MWLPTSRSNWRARNGSSTSPSNGRTHRTIDYLEYAELQAVLEAVDRATAAGRRDYALLATMFNTGARVQELLDVRTCDLHLDKPCPGAAVRQGA